MDLVKCTQQWITLPETVVSSDKYEHEGFTEEMQGSGIQVPLTAAAQEAIQSFCCLLL